MTDTPEPELPLTPHRPHYRLAAWLIAIVFFIALAPTLCWQEFSSGPENLVLATAMEMRRGGPWLVPTLQGEPRVAKPPLAAWMTALSIRPQTMRDIDTLDRDTRERGFLLLALESRWPALVAACLLLLGVFELGTVIGDTSLGLASMSIAATTYFLLRFSRYSTTDIQLSLWVTWANVFLARAIIRKRYAVGFIGAGITLGLAMLSKGPVALVQSVLPVAAFALFTRFSKSCQVSEKVCEESRGVGVPPAHWSASALSRGRDAHATTNSHAPSEPASKPRSIRFFISSLVGTILFTVIGLWWYALVMARTPNVLHRWFSEVTRIGATETAANSPFAYCAIVGYVMPWSIFFIVGLLVIGGQLRRRKITPNLLALSLLILPLIVMSFAKDRQDRYALPMIPAAAIIAAIGLRDILSRWNNPTKPDRTVIALHWITLAAIAVAFPLIAASGQFSALRQTNGQPWFSPQFAAIESSLGAALVLTGIFLYRRRSRALLGISVITMLVVQAAAFKGYCTGSAGRSELKPLADILIARYPEGTFLNAHPNGKRPPTDLGVYLNRTIRWTPDPSLVRVKEQPAVLFMLQNKGQPEPTPPAGWHFAGNGPRDKDWWWAFVLPPS